jgi:hypothetical protein
MTEQQRPRLVVEVVLGLAPATFLLLPFLLAGALGVATSAVVGGAINLATAMLIGWALGGRWASPRYGWRCSVMVGRTSANLAGWCSLSAWCWAWRWRPGGCG